MRRDEDCEALDFVDFEGILKEKENKKEKEQKTSETSEELEVSRKLKLCASKSTEKRSEKGKRVQDDMNEKSYKKRLRNML